MAGVVVLVLGAAAGGYLLAGGHDDRTASEPVATTTSTQASEPTTSAAPVTTAAPTIATTLAPVPAIDTVDLRAATYNIPCPLGTGPLRANDPTSENVLQAVEPTVVKDLTGDGRADALVSLECTARGGNSVVASVVVMSSERDGPHQVGDAVPGGAPVVIGATFVVADSRYEAEDPTCCPSGTAYTPYRVTGGRIGPATGRAPTLADQVTTAGFGAYEAGRSYAEVAAAAGQVVVVHRGLDNDESCQNIEFEGSFDGVSGLGDAGVLHMVYLEDPNVKTPSGLHLGSTEDDARRVLAADQLQVEDHLYIDGGHYLTFTPKDSPEHALVMETDGSTITLFKAGDAGWASAVEGCL